MRCFTRYAVSAEMLSRQFGRGAPQRQRGPVKCLLLQAETADPFGPAAFVMASPKDTPSRSFAPVTGRLHCLKNAVEIVGLRRLHWRELLVRHEFLRPQQLADRQHVPVIEISRTWRTERTRVAQQRLRVGANRLLEGITLDVGNLGPVEGGGPIQPADRGVGHHRSRTSSSCNAPPTVASPCSRRTPHAPSSPTCLRDRRA